MLRAAHALSSRPVNEPARLVLDTNVVFDCWIFRDPRCAGLAAALDSGRAVWLASAAMRDELVHTLARGQLHPRWAVEGAVAAWDRLARLQPEPPPTRLLCSDFDDQKFVDLAVRVGTGCWLLTRDRALLKLRRRAAAHGVTVALPEHWPAPVCA